MSRGGRVEPMLSAAMCTGGRSLAEPVLGPGGGRVAFVDRVGGLARLIVVPAAGGAELVVSADLAPAGRGGVVSWFPDGSRLAYATGTGQVAVVAASGGRPSLLWDRPGAPAAAVAVSPAGDEVAFVADLAEVVVAPVDGRPHRTVWSGADFVVDPAWSPDGRWLAWHEWDVPAMAWDCSRIRLASAAAAGGGGGSRVVAGGPGVSVQQPRFSPDGRRLAFLSDASGWLNVWVADADGGRARPLVAEAFEHGGPTWGPGQRTFAWSPDATAVAFERNEAGFGRLCVARVDGRGEVAELSRGVHGALSWAGPRLACLRGGARAPTTIVTLDPSTGTRAVVARGPVGGFEEAGLVEPEAVSWPAPDGATVAGRLYRGTPEFDGGSQPLPLLLWAHGGPTDQRRVGFDPSVAFFVDRGWAVLVADPRGSTGWGRAWAQALGGAWGTDEVADLAAGLRAAADNGWGAPDRMVPVGNSAGGSAVLWLLAAYPGLCAAGMASFPVSDLADLAARTHRYEAHYTTSLIGPLPGAAEAHRLRSPLHLADRIKGPLLLLHGSADEVVPAAQSVELAAAIGCGGGVVEHHEYDGEGHGWRRPATAADALARMEGFLERHVIQ